MRVSAYTQNLPHVAAGSRRAAELLVHPPAGVPDRHPDPHPAYPLVDRVVEGEILPRPKAVETLLNDPRNRVLQAQATPASPPRPDSGSGLVPSTVLFYQLHSSTESLSGNPVGRHVNQFV